ncbi:hypothetical protein ACQFN5_09985 [Klebsiella sp. WOUb02]|uniref:hypothetical protein n=1 Tax=Klebsiella sp. WOUb02 TaxID=3161071 RepID=UPI003CF6DB68
MNNENDNRIGMGLKLALAGVIVLVVLIVAAVVLLPMLQTVGGVLAMAFPVAPAVGQSEMLKSM